MHPFVHGLDHHVEALPPSEERRPLRRGAPERLRIAPLPPHLPRTWGHVAADAPGRRPPRAPGVPGVPALAGLLARWRAGATSS